MHPARREAAIEMVRPYLGQDFDDLLEDRFVLGSPEQVAEEIVKFHRAFGVNHMPLCPQWPGMPQSMTLEAMHRFAEEVLPLVRQGI